MPRWTGYAVSAVLLFVLYFVMVNAFFYAPTPTGKVRLMAMGADKGESGCEGAGYYSLTRIRSVGAGMVALDVQADEDGTLRVHLPNAESCPRDAGAMSLVEAARLRPLTPMLLTVDGGADMAERIVADFAEAKRDPVEQRDAFYGSPELIAALRAAWPGVWAMTADEIAACASDYRRVGWTGLTLPESCRDRTLVIPLSQRWLAWGWPDRMLARMSSLNGHVIVTDGISEGRPLGTGLTQPEQLGNVPQSYNGWLLVDDIGKIGPAILR